LDIVKEKIMVKLSNEFILKCECWCKMLKFYKFDDTMEDELYILAYAVSGNAGDITPWKRIKLAFSVLFKGAITVELYDIVVKKEELELFKEWVNKNV